MELQGIYEQLGVSPAVYAYGERVLSDLRERFDAIDQTAEYNQAKVLSAFQKNRVDASCFAATTGYGYNDVGREKLEQVYADVFHTQAALVRPVASPQSGWLAHLDTAACGRAGIRLFLPELRYCGDNAAMIGCQGYYEYQSGHVAGLDLNAYATRDISLG